MEPSSTKGTKMKQTKTAQIITESVALEFVDPQGDTTELEADLVFDPADPFAVTMVFRTGAQEVHWTFARDLLIEGFYEPTGDGDVHVWPCLNTQGAAVVILELSSPSGEVLVQVGSRELSAFIHQMVAMVPQGAEGGLVDLDAEIAQLLSA